MVGVANTASDVAASGNGSWEEVARRNGATDADIERARGNLAAAPASVRDAINDPATRQATEEYATRAAWYAVLGTMVAMVAAGVGGYCGSGPIFRLRPVVVDRVSRGRRNAPVVRT
jgi:hypothetical protein